MAEFLYATSHLAGDFTNPANAVGNTPGTWAGDLNTNTSQTSRWAIGDPADPLTAAATQTIRVVARKGTNSNDPTIGLNLYENGVLVQAILAATAVTSTSGQTLTGTFNSSAVSNPANVEIEVVMTATGGSPSARNSAQISHIEWEAATSPAAVEGQGSSSLTVSSSGTGAHTAVGSGSSTVAVTGTAAGVTTRQGTGASTVTVAATAAGVRTVAATATGSIAVTSTGAGEIPTGNVEGQGSSTVAVTSTASGVRTVTATATAAIDVGTSGSGTPTRQATGSSNITVDSTGSGTVAGSVEGQGSSVVSVSTSGSGHATHFATGSSNIVVTSTAQTVSGPKLVAALSRILGPVVEPRELGPAAEGKVTDPING